MKAREMIKSTVLVHIDGQFNVYLAFVVQVEGEARKNHRLVGSLLQIVAIQSLVTRLLPVHDIGMVRIIAMVNHYHCFTPFCHYKNTMRSNEPNTEWPAQI